MSPFFFLISLTVFFILILFVISLWFKKLEEKTSVSSDLVEWLKTSTSSFDQKLTKNLEVFAQLQKTIGEFSLIGRSMQELQEFLTSPKLRGNIGETILKEILSQNFPKDSYVIQYGFKNGTRVDAVIKTSQGIIPIDSKFPLDSFKRLNRISEEKEKLLAKKDFERDVKKHIEDISKKYILPEEKTVDYALMYIPSEPVYYELINNEEIFDFAGKNRVLPVSPMSFYAYMKAILMSFEGAKIETKAKEILEIIKAIKKDYQKTEDALNTLTKHITYAYNQTSLVTKNLSSMGQKLSSTNLLSSQSENKMIE